MDGLCEGRGHAGILVAGSSSLGTLVGASRSPGTPRAATIGGRRVPRLFDLASYSAVIVSASVPAALSAGLDTAVVEAT